MTLHAVDAASHRASKINIYSPDTDVFILSLRRYLQLCNDVHFLIGIGQQHQVINLKPIVQALGSTKGAALPGLHALSGADITVSFAGKGKATWRKVFREADEETTTALANRGKRAQPTAIFSGIEKLAGQEYVPNTTVYNDKEQRQWLFRKKQAQSETLPPTANYQAFVWNVDTMLESSICVEFGHRA